MTAADHIERLRCLAAEQGIEGHVYITARREAVPVLLAVMSQKEAAALIGCVPSTISKDLKAIREGRPVCVRPPSPRHQRRRRAPRTVHAAGLDALPIVEQAMREGARLVNNTFLRRAALVWENGRREVVAVEAP